MIQLEWPFDGRPHHGPILSFDRLLSVAAARHGAGARIGYATIQGDSQRWRKVGTIIEYPGGPDLPVLVDGWAS